MSFIKENQLVFENSSDSIIVLQDGLLKYINSNGFKIIGYEPEEIINHRFSEFVFEEDISLVESRYKKRLNNEPIPQVYPFRLVTKNGENVWFEIHAIEIMWEERPAHLVFFNNINKRKLAEEALSKRESQIRAVLNAVPDMLFQVRKDGTISSFRPAKVSKTEYPDDFTGKHIAEIIPAELFDECLNKITEAFNTKEVAVFEFPVENLGRKRFFESRIVAYSHEEVLALIRDITKRKLKEEALEKNQEFLQKELKRLKSSIKGRNPFDGIVGRSKKMLDVFDEILKASSGSAHVIIHGESGTGKELVARAVHDLSDRCSRAFVPVNCGAIPENLLESEFFGYRKGAFTGALSDKKGFMELADSGTLFMDEIGEINLNMQVKLLRAIEGGGFIPVGGNEVITPDIRIIGATNKNPFDLVKQKLLREDFFYRINIIQINLPPLRDRLEDLPLLVYHFLEKFGKGANFPSIPSAVMDRLMSHSWPGNIRELQNAVHRYVTMGKIELPTMEVLSETEEDFFDEPGAGTDLKNALKNFEKRHILKVLESNKWQKGRTASLLGVHRKTLFRKLKELGIE